MAADDDWFETPEGGFGSANLQLVGRKATDPSIMILEDEYGGRYLCQAGTKPSAMMQSSCGSGCNCSKHKTKRARTHSAASGEIGIYSYQDPGEEIKSIDHVNTESEIVVSSDPFRIALNAIKLGDQFYERVGGRIVMKDLEVWYRIVINDNGLKRKDVCRIIILYDRACSGPDGKGEFPNKDAYIASYQDDGSTRHTAEDFANPTQTKRFLFLQDRWIYLSNDGTGSDSLATNGEQAGIDRSAKVAGKFKIDLKGLTTTYKPHALPEGNPSIKQITAGSLLFIVFGLHPEDQGWNLHYSIRLRYQDG